MDYDTKLINLALDAGEVMLSSGAETFRVQDTMRRILSVSGREKIEALALSTMLIVTLPRAEKGPLSMARGVQTRAVNFEKICAVNSMSRAFVSGNISLDEAAAQLHNIHETPAFSPIVQVLGYGLASGGFSYIYSYSATDGFFAFFIGMLLGALMQWIEHRNVPYFLNSFVGGLATGIAACIIHRAFPMTHMDKMIIGSIMPLLPGLTLAKSIRDLLEGNFISGNSKMMEALLIACAIAGGVAIALGLFF